MLVNEIADPLAPHRAVTADACLYRSRTRSSVRFSAVSRLMSQGRLFGFAECAPASSRSGLPNGTEPCYRQGDQDQGQLERLPGCQGTEGGWLGRRHMSLVTSKPHQHALPLAGVSHLLRHAVPRRICAGATGC